MSVVVSANAASAGAPYPVSGKFAFYQGGILLAVYAGATSAHGEKQVLAAISRDNGVTWGDLDDGPGETILVDDGPFGAGRLIPRADRGLAAGLDPNGDLWIAYAATRTNGSYVAQAELTCVNKYTFDGTTWGYASPVYSNTSSEESAGNYHRRHVILPARSGGRCHVSYLRHAFSWRTVTHKVGSAAVASTDTAAGAYVDQQMAFIEEPNGTLHQVWVVRVDDGTGHHVRHRTAADGSPPSWSAEANVVTDWKSGTSPTGFAATALQGQAHFVVYDPGFDGSNRYRHGVYSNGAWTVGTVPNLASDVGFSLNAWNTGDERIVLVRRDGGNVYRAIYTDGTWSVGWTSIWTGESVDWAQGIARTAVDHHAFAWTASDVLRTQPFTIPARPAGAGKLSVGTFNRKGLVNVV